MIFKNNFTDTTRTNANERVKNVAWLIIFR